MGIMFGWEFLFTILVPVWVIVRVAISFLKLKSKKAFSLTREIWLGIFFIYILCVFAVAFFPLRINWDNGRSAWFSVNIVPIYSTLKKMADITSDPNMRSFMIKFWIRNVGGNILLLLPLGAMLPFLWKRFESPKKTILFGFCFSLCIEILQLLSGLVGNRGRVFDIDDILLNTVGICLGFIIFNSAIKKIKIVTKGYQS